MSDKILVVLEPDNHPMDVLSRAEWLAQAYGADVTLLWCDQDVSPLGKPFLVSNEAEAISEQILEAQIGIIDELAAPLQAAGIHVDRLVLEERPIAEAILHYVDLLQPGFLLKGTHYHPAAERSIFVDTDWHLMRSSECPIWLVKPGKMATDPVIVAAVDPIHSHDKPAALDHIIIGQSKDIADRANGSVILLHTYDVLMGVGAAATRTFKPIKLAVDQIGEEMRNDHRQKLDTLAEQNGIDQKCTHQLAGHAHELIPAFAREVDASLVVMGALARWGIKRAVIGSTAERVLDQLPCDVLVVRKQDA